MSGDPLVRFGGRGHRTQSMLPTPIVTPSPDRSAGEAASSSDAAMPAGGKKEGNAARHVRLNPRCKTLSFSPYGVRMSTARRQFRGRRSGANAGGGLADRIRLSVKHLISKRHQ
jgi:hypothetical protein